MGVRNPRNRRAKPKSDRDIGMTPLSGNCVILMFPGRARPICKKLHRAPRTLKECYGNPRLPERTANQALALR